MEWSRVKSILIVALLLTNVVIILFIAYDGASENKMTITEQRDLIDKILSNANVENRIAKNIPIIDMMPQLTIAYQTYDMSTLAREVLGDYSVNNGFYQAVDYKMTFNDNTLYIVSVNADKEKMTNLKQAKEVATSFIKRYFGESDDFELLDYNETKNEVSLQYGQKYQDYHIYDTAMRVVVKGDKVALFERKWMTVQVAAKDKQPVKACCQALFSAIDRFSERAPTTIEAVDLGYRLEKTLLGENVKSGDALPYYRFMLKDDQQLFVPALSDSFY